MVADDITTIFDAIVAERRLTGVAHLAVARSMAMMLAQSEPDVRGISSLASLLPPAPADASEAKYDVALLGADEFKLLDYLLRCAMPGAEKPERPRDLLAAYSRDYTMRELQGLELAQLLDAIELRDRVPDHVAVGATDQERLDDAIEHYKRHREAHPAGPTADERPQLSNLLTSLFGLVARIEDIQPWLAETPAPAPAAAPAPGVPAEPSAPSRPPLSDLPVQGNVTPMRPRSIHEGEHSLARGSIAQPLGGGVSNERKSFSRFDNNSPLP